MMSLTACLLVAVGGAIGTLARYLVAVAALPISRHFPWSTVGINVAGSFVIGFWATFSLSDGRAAPSESTRLFVMVGFCGGFTTFSSFSLQTFDLIRGGDLTRAALNIVLSVVLCLGAVALGDIAGSRLGGATSTLR